MARDGDARPGARTSPSSTPSRAARETATSSQLPNWVTCAWPPDYLAILDWQWQRVRPSVLDRSKRRSHATVEVKVAIEMHPGFAVYTPETLLRLRRATGSNLGCNFDPSHLFWQGIDPVVAIRALAAEDGIFHVHAKDTLLSRTRHPAQRCPRYRTPRPRRRPLLVLLARSGSVTTKHAWRAIFDALALGRLRLRRQHRTRGPAARNRGRDHRGDPVSPNGLTDSSGKCHGHRWAFGRPRAPRTDPSGKRTVCYPPRGARERRSSATRSKRSGQRHFIPTEGEAMNRRFMLGALLLAALATLAATMSAATASTKGVDHDHLSGVRAVRHGRLLAVLVQRRARVQRQVHGQVPRRRPALRRRNQRSSLLGTSRTSQPPPGHLHHPEHRAGNARPRPARSSTCRRFLPPTRPGRTRFSLMPSPRSPAPRARSGRSRKKSTPSASSITRCCSRRRDIDSFPADLERVPRRLCEAQNGGCYPVCDGRRLGYPADVGEPDRHAAGRCRRSSPPGSRTATTPPTRSSSRRPSS